jgi:hypothetical protein
MNLVKPKVGAKHELLSTTRPLAVKARQSK